jgi:hypothetical protein
MTKFIEALKGKKTYLLAFALFAYAFGGYFTGHLTAAEAIGLVWGSGVVSALRAAISKSN